MTIRGTVKNGKVLLDNPGAFPEGTEVEVSRVTKRKPAAKPRKPKTKTRPRSLAERFANVIGKATGLPADAAFNHDHHRNGLPKSHEAGSHGHLVVRRPPRNRLG
jgi:hypothetical protein